MKTFAMLAFAALAMVVGCGENQSNPMTSTSTDFAPQPAAKNAAPGATHFDLTAGRHTVIGEVTIWNDATNLYVNYNTDESGIGLVTTHVNVNSAADGADGQWMGDEYALDVAVVDLGLPVGNSPDGPAGTGGPPCDARPL